MLAVPGPTPEALAAGFASRPTDGAFVPRERAPEDNRPALRTAGVSCPLLWALALPGVVQAQFAYTTANGTITITGTPVRAGP